MGAGIPQITPEALADQDYAMRAKRQDDLGTARAYFAAHPEELPKTDTTAGMQPPTSPAEAEQQRQQVEGGGTDMTPDAQWEVVQRLTQKAGGSDETAKWVNRAVSAGMLALPLVGKLRGAGGAAEALSGAEDASTAAEQAGTILDAAGKPMSQATAPVAESALSAVSTPPPEVTEAAQTLAQKQLDALKTVRVGKTVAEEFGNPEIATQMSNEDTMKAAQDLRMNLESVYNDPIKPPELSAQTAGLAKVFQGESQDLHDTATGLLQRMNAGEDVSKDIGDLSNRFSAFAVQYAKIAGARSEMGRGLQILDPLKPENVRVTETAKLAQQLSEGNNSRDLVEMLARLTPDQLPRTARQMQETVSTGGAIYNAIHEYYIDNLLSDAGRTSGRIGLSNSVSSIMQLASRQVASMLPGSPIKAGEPLAQMQGISDGLWHAVDAAMESAKTGERVAMMEDAPEASPLLANPSIAAKPFGLEGTTLGTALDYLGSVMRMPQRGLAAVHQFGWSIAKSMEMHGLAWRQAIDGAQGEGLSGAEGYKRATEIYRGAIKAGFSPEVRAAASNAADVTTFANAIEGKYPQALQTLAHAPGINLVIPFFRVAYNVKKMGLDYTPGVGALTGMATADDSAAKYMVAGKQALASVMAGLVAHEVVKGNLTGDGPPPGAARDALMEQGWRPNSWKVGDRYIKVPEPLAFPLSVVANTVELGKQLDAPTYEQRAAMVVQAMARAFANDSLVQGIVNLKQWANDAEEQGFGPASEKFAGKTAAGFVPFSGLLGAIHRSQDPYVRNPRTMGEQVKSQLPDLPGGLASQYTAGSVSPRYDIFGKPVVGMPGVPENLLYPVNVTKEKLDPVESMIAAVQPNFAKVPTVISGRKQKLLDDPNNPDIGVPLTPAEQDKWAKTRGEGLYEQFDNLRRSPAFENSSTDMKKTMLEYVGAKYAEIATAKMLAEPVMMARYVARQKARAATLTPHDMSTASTEAPSIEP